MDAAPQMLLASRLRDGRAVFLRADGGWSERIEDGLVAEGAVAAAALLQRAEAATGANLIVDPYLIRVRLGTDGPEPVDWRESIRAHGPTVESRPRG